MAARRHLLALLFVGVLTACSSSGSDSGTADAAVTETNTPTTTEAPTTTAAPTTTPTTTAAPATTAEPTTTSATTVAAPAPWTPIGTGPHQVGVATVTVDDPDGVRPLTVDVWFPIDDEVDTVALPPQQYTFLPGVYYESPAAFAATPEQIENDEQFPLIVYSHGSNGLRYIHSSYTEALAGHGHIVVAADHTGNTALDYIAGTRAPGAEVGLDRLADVRRLIDAFTDPSDPVAGPYAGQVDADQIVVTGHSAGGFTSLATVTGYGNDLGETAADQRVDAIVLLAPAVGSSFFDDDLLATVDTPMMAVVGTNDVTTPADPNVTRLWDLTTGVPAYRVELVDGAHQTFTDLCAYIPFLATLDGVPEIVAETIDDFATEGCAPGDIDQPRAAELTNSYVIRFLDEVLGGGPPIDPATMATPADVVFFAR